MSGARVQVLANGVEMPMLALGTWQVPDGDQAERAVGWALEAGYRHIDTAQGYGNEASVGRALARSDLPRSEVFLTTKFNPAADDPEAEAERSLERLGTDRIDLYLVHWPQGGPTRAWRGMERALESGLARAIGVSNFSAKELGAVCAHAASPPAVNQVQLSPFHGRSGLLAACGRLGVVATAYSPLTHGEHLADPVVAEVAHRVGRTPAQVLLRWGLQHDLTVIPKSVHRERIAENARIFDFSLPGEDMAALDALDLTGGTTEAHEEKWWTVGARLRARLERLRG